MALFVRDFQVGEKLVTVYWRGKVHRYLFSIDHGVETFETTKAKGEAIMEFLKILEK